MTPAAFTPTKTQLRVWDVIHRAPAGSLSLIGYGGAAGGGKTRTLAELAIDLCLSFPGTKVLIGRKDFADLRTTTMDEFYTVCPPELLVKRHDSEHWCAIRLPDWPEGVTSRVFFKELKDWLSLGSEQYGAVLIEEAGEVPEKSALMLLSRLRHPGPSKYVFVAASNPWPGWFESWFVKRDLPEDLLRDLNATVTFIPALIRDNPHLQPSPEAYEARLRALYPSDWVDRLVDGRFDAFVGQVYTGLSRSRHLWVGTLPRFSRYVGGLDFGGQNPHDHMTAGVVAGLVAPHQPTAREDALLRFGAFEDRGPKVYERLLAWMRGVEAQVHQRVEWVADRSQMWGIDLLKAQGFLIQGSHGGADSVDAGIGLQNRRFEDAGASWFTEELLSAEPGAAARGARSWFERMTEYRWAEEPANPSSVVPRVPIKRADDVVDADRYLHEAADGFPVQRYRKTTRDMAGRPLATEAV